MPKSKLSSRDIRLLVGFAIFAEAILGYFVLIDPVLSKISRQEQEAKRQEILLREIQAMVMIPHAPIASGPPVYSETSGRGAILIQQNLGDWMAQDGNEVSSLMVTPGDEKGIYHCKSSFVGSFATLSRFIDRLERPPYLMGLQSLSVRNFPEKDSLEVELDLALPIAER